MFPQYKHRLGIGCALCKHVWFILTDDDEVSEDLQLEWVKDVLLEHREIHKEQEHDNDGFQE